MRPWRLRQNKTTRLAEETRGARWRPRTHAHERRGCMLSSVDTPATTTMEIFRTSIYIYASLLRMVGSWYAYVFSDVSGAMGRRHAPRRQSRPHIRTHKTKRSRGLTGRAQPDEEQASHARRGLGPEPGDVPRRQRRGGEDAPLAAASSTKIGRRRRS